MPHEFHIAFPFEVAANRLRPGEHAALCPYPIPLSFTETYRCDAIPGFAFTRQWYANELLTVDLIEGSSPEPFTALLKQSKTPSYVLAVLLEGLFRYDYPDGSAYEAPQPGTVYFARLGGLEYAIHFPAKTSRMLIIAVHAAQLNVIGEDFDELAELLEADGQTGDIIGPPIQADNLLKRRLIKLISPEGIKRRKDFNQHLVAHLPGVCSAIKGLLRGKGQAQYDQDKLASIIDFIDQQQLEHGRVPDLTTVLNHACISEAKLDQLFRERRDASPAAYLSRLNMESVYHCLIETDDPIYLIAQHHGYSDSAALNKPFKKHFGISPAQVRKQNRSC